MRKECVHKTLTRERATEMIREDENLEMELEMAVCILGVCKDCNGSHWRIYTTGGMDVIDHILILHLYVYSVCSHVYTGKYTLRHAKGLSLSALFPRKIEYQ